jgi:hypothetical protein
MASKKRDSIDILFTTLYAKNPDQNVIQFSNAQLKEITQDTKFMNQFDAVKFDSAAKLPNKLKEKGYFIVHLGKGNHAFVKGNGYHKLEKITDIKKMELDGGLIDKIGESEAGAISYIYNTGIIQDFLEVEKLKMQNARRSKVSFEFKVNGSKLFADGQQIEIDGMFETDAGVIIAVEAKNRYYGDFEIRQLFSIEKYFEMLIKAGKLPKDTQIKLLFFVRLRDKTRNICRIYEYKFTDKEDLNSIKFIRAVEYQIK